MMNSSLSSSTMMMMRKPFHLTFLLLVLSSLEEACLGDATSKFQVHIPKSLTKKDGYDHRDALFGIPPYGGSINQQIYYADSTLCDQVVDTHKGYPEREKDSESGQMKGWQAPFILMVDRGECTFVTKVRHAQDAGAAGVIIADNTCLCYDQVCIETTQTPTCEEQEPIMADDGKGVGITIPSFLLFKQDADPIKDALKSNQHVAVEMSFAVPAPDARVEYDLWTTAKDPVTRPFLSSFKEAAVALGAEAFFTPHMYIYDGMRAGCQGIDGSNQCFTLCTNNGRYCSTDPDTDLERGISGADVVTESLRRMCIWQLYGDDGVGREWWDYVEEFIFRCDNPSTPGMFTNVDCITDALQHAGIPKHKVDGCMSDSGGLEGDVTNSVIEEELAKKDTSGVALIPSLFVNKAPVRGSLSFATVFKAICAGYSAGSEPNVCITCSTCRDEAKCVANGKCTDGYSSLGGGAVVKVPVFAGTIAAITVIFAIFGFIQYRRQQAMMHAQVRGIMAEYMPLDVNQSRPADTSVGGIPDNSLT